MLLSLSVLGLASMTFATDASAEVVCSGHKLLPIPRPQSSCIAGFSDMINGEPTVSGDFHFVGSHTVVASTWKRPGSLDDKAAVTVDLEEAFAKLAPSAD
jgi:hypothetical protein